MNSPLATIYIPSPFHSGPRQQKIKGVAIHCTAGKTTAEALGNWFQREGLDASSNYGIGYDGSIGCYVDEANRSWCTSNGNVDNACVTIEVSTDSTPPYKCTAASYVALIKLLTDICLRNDIDSLKWEGDKSLMFNWDKQNMVVHRWCAAKACPGDYLYSLHPQIAKDVNAALTAARKNAEASKVDEGYEQWKAYYERYRASKSDMPDWAESEIAEAIKDGITDGERPLAPVNRVEAALMIFRAVKKYLSHLKEDDGK